ncbi:hypothetical protein SLOPH_1859 [Spraguea lophii 42_110]|uniref:Protein yippee-like n=1 Tax=Spraguea lophii (strain 42_110) TaxID=1358809 RepID=S7XIA3_SPRLO|nr:hypothetical protein SLOPH_1859 [Spraguea lophii 42_110]
MSLHNPFVIQCESCKLIIGESFALIDYRNNKLILEYVSSNISEITNNKIKCKCGKIVGNVETIIQSDENKNNSKISKSITEITEQGKKLYYIEKNNVTTFVLGYTDTNLMGISELSEEVYKLQKFCTMLYEKINKK